MSFLVGVLFLLDLNGGGDVIDRPAPLFSTAETSLFHLMPRRFHSTTGSSFRAVAGIEWALPGKSLARAQAKPQINWTQVFVCG
ncbi:hypothetical protein [Aliiruegeria sabulilitoris]|uniref:hypothetical protein n=1 Tax=Aliiruegeria sabulilitoris TaxID=1510458 RepID=UPI000836AA34|nr:hypothetical protein [Aliiruegeria sabulilitoris]NDR58713.1 hypothetical protein [Pseudoruegeria sp. M32A2M]